MFRFMLLGMRFYFFSASAPAAAPRASVTSRRGFLRTASAVIAATALVGGLSACVVDNSDSNNSSSKNSSGDKALTVFATTGYIGDAVHNIAPDADVSVMVGPGGDPHTYQPTTQDLAKIQDSSVVLWTGPDMETHMADELEAQSDRQFAVSSAIPEQDLLPWQDHDEHGHDHDHGKYDPHIWNSTTNWKYVVDGIAKKLGEVDSGNADTYKKNAESYKQQIDEAGNYVQTKMTEIPQDRRILVSGHDTFNYFGKQFGLDVKATDLITSESELSATELNELADFIAQRKVPTIFGDNSANPQAINSLKEAVKSKGWDVNVSTDELYADSLGAEAPTDTYVGVMRYNADTIHKALVDPAATPAPGPAPTPAPEQPAPAPEQPAPAPGQAPAPAP